MCIIRGGGQAGRISSLSADSVLITLAGWMVITACSEWLLGIDTNA